MGLRHPHYGPALANAADLDFVEVHAENFFVDGGANLAVLERARELYDISLHCTALGLGSAAGVSGEAVTKLAKLVERVDPILVSDHLCFCWVDLNGRRRHMGDLLPVQRTRASLAVLQANIDRVQQAIGRPLLLENISTYADDLHHELSETEYLCHLVQSTGCQLLVDINNLLVNAHNKQCAHPYADAVAWLDRIPAAAVGEIHLAGHTRVAAGNIAVDDHAAPVSGTAWQVYQYALRHLGKVPTLIEWDTRLPAWPVLLEEAAHCRRRGNAANANRSKV